MLKKRNRSPALSINSRPVSPDSESDAANAIDEGRRVHFGSNRAYSQAIYSQTDAAEGEEEEEAEEEEEELESGWNGQGIGAVLAINSSRGRVGCCYYDENGKLYLMEDGEDSSNWDLVVSLIEQIQPRLVFTSISAESTFLEILQKTLESTPPAISTSDSTTSESTDEVRLEYRPARDFHFAQGKNSLAGLRIVEGMEYESREEEMEYGRRNSGADDDRSKRNSELRLGSFLNDLESSPLTLGCAGAIIAHLSRTLSSNGELDVESNLLVQGLELLTLQKYMIINSDALVSLQIFESESHASIHSDRTKEGLSLLGIMNVTRTPLGKFMMKQWFLRPSLDIELIESRYDAVECFLRGENQHVMETIQTQFKSIKNIPKTLKTLSSGKGGINEWSTVFNYLYGAILIREALTTLTVRRGVEIVEKILACIDPAKLQNLGNMIHDIIDWEESSLTSQVCVKAGVNEDLDDMKRKYHGLDSLLQGVANDISRDLSPEVTQAISVVYFPQLGYLVAFPAPEEDGYGQTLEIDGFDFQFKTEVATYYKEDKCRDLDRHLGDLHSWISDKYIEIIHSLLSTLMEHEKIILQLSDTLSELDCLLAFAEVSRVYGWNRPVLTEANVFRVQGARHPLVEIVVDSYVKSDLSLVGGRGAGWEPEQGEENGQVDDAKSVLIITGANYSGKSIVLKEVALITFMAHLGSFVPAEYSLIGLTDKILTRVSTRESISRGSSAFMIDLQQISLALRNLTVRSLLIIDEFGKGTSNSDGAGLFGGVIENLIERGTDCPRVVVATHFQDLIANGLIADSPHLELAHMEIHLEKSSTVGSSTQTNSNISYNEITYLYQLKAGLATSSHAIACAALYNIPTDPYLIRAERVTKLLIQFEMDELFNEDLSEAEINQLKESEKIVRRFIEWDLEGGEEDFESLLERLKEVLKVEVDVI